MITRILKEFVPLLVFLIALSSSYTAQKYCHGVIESYYVDDAVKRQKDFKQKRVDIAVEIFVSMITKEDGTISLQMLSADPSRMHELD